MPTDTLYEQPVLCTRSCVCPDVYNPIDLFLCHLSVLYPSTKRLWDVSKAEYLESISN